ncbi:MAG TPA: hypothetical protein VH040_04605 [Usitatibacter sp.]|jgi:hypothetical protein|nr:hypothetical protein [Usitatibacter sp.]
MTIQQRLATAFLALLIVGSVAMMPADADSKPRAALPQHAAGVVATSSQARPTHDLTYN